MSVVVLEVMPGDDPNGTPVLTLTDDDLATLEIRVAENALGSAQFSINRHNANLTTGTDDLLIGGSYCKITIAAIQAEPVFGFWIDENADTLIASDEEGAETLTRGGPGALFILDHATLLDTIHDPSQTARGDRTEDPWWTWVNEPYGAILTRGITEGQNEPGTPLQDVTIDFDRTDDSDSNPWPELGEEKLIQIEWGTSIYQLYQRLIASGQLFVRARANLLIQAYRARGVDRTSTTFASGKVRFEKGINIDTELVRSSRGTRAADRAFVKGKNNVVAQVGAGGLSPGRWVTVDYGDSDDPDLLEAVGEETLRIRDAELEGLELELRMGDDQSAGYYLPWKHFDTGDLVTLHTGSGPNEYENADARITGFRVTLRSASNDDTAIHAQRSLATVVEFNSGQESAVVSSGIDDTSTPTHNHPPNPSPPPECVPDAPGTSLWHWSWDVNDLDDTATYSGGLIRHAGVWWGPADTAFGVGAYGSNSAPHRATQKFTVPGNTPLTFTLPIMWQYDSAMRNVTVQWFGSGGTVLLSTEIVVTGAGHAFGGSATSYNESVTLTSPVGADEAVVDFSPFAGVHVGDLDISTAGEPADNDPFCLADPGDPTNPHYAQSDDPRFDAPNQHVTTRLVSQPINNSGGALQAGALVIGDETLDDAVTTSTAPLDASRMQGLVIEGGADGEQLTVLWQGVGHHVPDLGAETTAPGEYLFSSTTAGQADADATRAAGAFGRVVTVDADDKPSLVEWWGIPDSSSAVGGGSGALDWFIVTDPAYGAVGDDSTDDTAAITAAINAAVAAGGGIVYFPALTYKITSLITITAGALQDGIHLMGAQAGDLGNNTGSVIHQATNNTGALLFATNIYQSYITNLFFHGPTTHASGIGIEHVRNVIYHNVSVNNFGTGVKMGVSSFYSKAYRLGVYNCTTGVLNANGSNNVDYYACRISTCTTGFSVQGSEKVAFYGGEVEACTTGILLDSGANMTSGVTVSGVYFENSAGSTDIRVGDTTSIKGVIITGNKFTAHTTGFHIDAQYVDGLVIQANDFRKTTGTAIRTQSPATGVLTGPNRYNGATDSLSGNARIIDPETDVTPGTIAAAASAGTSRYWMRADAILARGTTPANTVSITDTGAYFTGTDVEAALQEIGAGGIGGGTSGTGSDHAHIVDELFSGDGATTVFSLANEAVTETAMAYIAGVRTPVTVGGAMNDEVTFAAAPGSGTDNVSIDYVAVSA